MSNRTRMSMSLALGALWVTRETDIKLSSIFLLHILQLSRTQVFYTLVFQLCECDLGQQKRLAKASRNLWGCTQHGCWLPHSDSHKHIWNSIFLFEFAFHKKWKNRSPFHLSPLCQTKIAHRLHSSQLSPNIHI